MHDIIIEFRMLNVFDFVDKNSFMMAMAEQVEDPEEMALISATLTSADKPCHSL